ncbi:ATP-dependent RNA helicase A-like protein [Anas platyrhynchos]|uniref:ATP-dependent RNA helicase A-like protein n=1 Tax=Anas platyrhynchos TaxID=8839 RepID=R0LRV0_ANAPL|nr:ATP-dependent RNA helicase A-like protein [Anas platyrhynchos]
MHTKRYHRLSTRLCVNKECLMTQPFNSTGPDNNLDVVISLLAFGSTPMSAATRRRGKFLTLRGTMPSTSHLFKLKMPHSVAACIPAVHAAMEALTVEVTKDLGII